MPSEIDVSCPGCNAVFSVPAELCGEMAECSECAAVFEIPRLDERPDAIDTDTGAIRGVIPAAPPPGDYTSTATNTVKLSRSSIGMIPTLKESFTFGQKAPGPAFGAPPPPPPPRPQQQQPSAWGAQPPPRPPQPPAFQQQQRMAPPPMQAPPPPPLQQQQQPSTWGAQPPPPRPQAPMPQAPAPIQQQMAPPPPRPQAPVQQPAPAPAPIQQQMAPPPPPPPPSQQQPGGVASMLGTGAPPPRAPQPQAPVQQPAQAHQAPAAPQKPTFTRPPAPPQPPPAKPATTPSHTAPVAAVQAPGHSTQGAPAQHTNVKLPTWTAVQLKQGEEAVSYKEDIRNPAVPAILVSLPVILSAAAVGVAILNPLFGFLTVVAVAILTFIVSFVILKGGAKRAVILTTQRAICIFGKDRIELKK